MLFGWLYVSQIVVAHVLSVLCRSSHRRVPPLVPSVVVNSVRHRAYFTLHVLLCVGREMERVCKLELAKEELQRDWVVIGALRGFQPLHDDLRRFEEDVTAPLLYCK